MVITVVGLGFVGLTTALGFAKKGHAVHGWEADAGKRRGLQRGRVPFHEPGLKEALGALAGKRFFVADSLGECVRKSDAVFYCVGTPSRRDGSADLSILLGAVRDTLAHLPKGSRTLLVIKSTVPPSTTQERIRPYIERRGFRVGRDVGLANNPEFLREGFAWEDFMTPDRVVAGVSDTRAEAVLRRIYKPFNAPLHFVTLNEGEFIKYLSNTLLATMISYSNEMSLIARAVGDIRIRSTFRILHGDKRWSGAPAKMASYVYPGCGYGGYCLPKDTQALLDLSRRKGYAPSILAGVIRMNRDIKKHLFRQVAETTKKREVVGILGLSFKPGSDDVRDSPATPFIRMLLDHGYRKIVAYDPMANAPFRKEHAFPIRYASSMERVARESDAVLILTGWEEFRQKKALLNGKKVFDFRYLL